MNIKRRISILKEKRKGEDRVVIVPRDVELFQKAGYDVYVENDAGVGAGFENQDYVDAGAKIVATETAWSCSSFVAKLKAPGPAEYKFFHNNLNLCAFYHLENNPLLADELCRNGVTAFSYEFLETEDGNFPISIPQSEISGKMAVIYGAYHLQSSCEGRGILLADTIGTRKPKVVIIGYGNAGGAAIKTALALGLDVVVIGANSEKLRKFRNMLPSDVKCYINSPEVLEREVVNADLVIGAILISTYDTPPMIDENIVKKMKPGSMIIDITCGYGRGYLPTFKRFSTHHLPTYKVHNVLHCKIDSLPSSVPVTASQALSHQLTPYLIKLADSVFENNYTNSILNTCRVTENGKVVHEIVYKNLELYNNISKSIPGGNNN